MREHPFAEQVAPLAGRLVLVASVGSLVLVEENASQSLELNES